MQQESVTHDTTSEFLTHEACPSCGSKDNLARYTDGHAYCFGCGYYESSTEGTTKMQEKKDSKFYTGRYKALPSRRITEETCRKWGYQVGDDCHIANYYDDKRQVVGQKIRRQGKDFHSVGKPKDAGLYGKWLWPAGKYLVITEGELDALSVSQAQNHKWPVVSVPNGAQGAKKSIKDNLKWIEENYQKVVFMFDNDSPGREAAEECAALLSPGKAFVASLPLKDASDMLKAGRGGEIVEAIFKAKEHKPFGIVSVSEVKSKIGSKPTWGVETPWKSLTKLTYGLKPSQLWTWTSGTGMGKTTFFKEMINTLLNNNKRVGVIFLEEQAQDTVVSLAGLAAGKSFFNPEGEDCTEERDREVEKLEATDNLRFYDNFGHDDYDSIKAVIRHMVVGYECEYIFLDHLTAFTDGLSGSDANALTERMMKELATMCRELNFNLQLITHIRKSDGNRKPAEEGGRVKIDDMKGSGAIKQWSNFVIGLEGNRQAKDEDEANTTCIRILKSRDKANSVGKRFHVTYSADTGRLTEVDDILEEIDDDALSL